MNDGFLYDNTVYITLCAYSRCFCAVVGVGDDDDYITTHKIIFT